MTAPELPPAARTLLRQLDDWSTHVTCASGELEFNALSEDTDGEGKRRRILVLEPVDSVLLRGAHVDGRALVALWIRRATRAGWKLDLAWRGRRADEFTPKQITATELKAYVAPVPALARVA